MFYSPIYFSLNFIDLNGGYIERERERRGVPSTVSLPNGQEARGYRA